MAHLELPADRQEWLKLRRGYIGGSEIAALFGPEFSAAFQLSRFALHHIKAGHVQEPDVDNEIVRMGLIFERSIAEEVCKRNGWTLYKGVYATDDTTPGMGASLDFIVDPGPAGADRGLVGLGVLQIKKVLSTTFYQKWDGEQPPAYIMLQLQHEMACAGLGWGAVGGLVGTGDKLICPTYLRNEKLITSIRAAVTDFWHGVHNDIEPSLDEKESTKEVLRALFPQKDPEKTVDLHGDNEIIALCEREKALAAQKKATEAELETVRNKIRHKIGDARYALVPGFKITRSVGEDTPDRVAEPGEIIKGRKGADRLTISLKKAA